MTITYISKEKLTTPKDGYEVITNSYWWEKDGMILDWKVGNRTIPQTNKSKEVMEVMKNKSIYSGHDYVLIPVAYYPRESGYY